jgi:hypothetical protein
MAIGAGSRGTARLLPGLQKARCCEAAQTLLGNKEMSSQTQRKMPCMGISSRPFVLVYQWNHL